MVPVVPASCAQLIICIAAELWLVATSLRSQAHACMYTLHHTTDVNTGTSDQLHTCMHAHSLDHFETACIHALRASLYAPLTERRHRRWRAQSVVGWEPRCIEQRQRHSQARQQPLVRVSRSTIERQLHMGGRRRELGTSSGQQGPQVSAADAERGVSAHYPPLVDLIFCRCSSWCS